MPIASPAYVKRHILPMRQILRRVEGLTGTVNVESGVDAPLHPADPSAATGRLYHPRESSIPQRELGHLRGYRGSQPVRVGNRAWDQSQLDVYGEVLDGVFRTEPEACDFSRDDRGLIAGDADFVSEHCRDADYGIWELQEKAQLYPLQGPVLAGAGPGHQAAGPVQGISQEGGPLGEGMREIAAVLHQRGYNEEIVSFVQRLDGRDPF